jgi:hypothetical protein
MGGGVGRDFIGWGWVIYVGLPILQVLFFFF